MSSAVELLERTVSVLVPLGMLALLVKNWRKLASADRWATDEVLDGPDICRRCGYDIRGGFERCPECGLATFAVQRKRLAELRSKLPPDPATVREPSSEETEVPVYSDEHQAVIDLLRDHLEARGIKTQVERPSRRMAKPVHRLAVWSGDRELAIAIIQSVWDEAE